MLPHVLATMAVKNCKETESLSTSERSFNSLTLFLDFTLTSDAFFTYRRTSGGGGEGGEQPSFSCE